MCVDLGEKKTINVPLGGGRRLESGDQLLNISPGLGESLVLLRDAAAGVEYGRVVTPAQELADFNE